MKKKIALLGDSIRLIGYGKKVPDMLGEEFEVFQPTDNCRFAKYTLRYTVEWKKHLEGCDLIHWNNGLWDATTVLGDGCFTPVEEYVEEMCRLARRLLTLCPKVVFATTTPVREEAEFDKNDIIDEFNAALVPRLREMGIIINDLNSLLRDNTKEYICDDYLHLSDKGADIAALQVCKVIKENI